MKKFKTALIAILSVAVVALGGVAILQNKGIIGTQGDALNTQVIKSVEREEQVVLLSLGIEGLAEKSSNKEVLGVGIPWTDRTQFVQYSYKAKLGIEGKDVKVEQTGEHAYKVTIPRFIFIGHSDEHFKTAVNDNGALSWITPELDAADTVSKILDEGEKKQNISDNRGVLQDQAKDFYMGIIRSVDNNAELEFSFK